MGYRSEVAIRCDDEAYKMFKEAIEATGVITPNKIFHKKNDHLIYWSSVKWYESYPEVVMIEKVMSKLDEMDEYEATEKKMGYKFLRIGENDSDVEMQCNVYDIELYMIRQIDLSDFDSSNVFLI